MADLVTCLEASGIAVVVVTALGLFMSAKRDAKRIKKADKFKIGDKDCPRLSELPSKNEEIFGGTWPPPQPKVGRILPVKDLFAANAELIRKICQASQLPEDEYDAYLLPAISNLARIVHQLPASQYDHHSGFGGLFTHSLEVALFAAQEANATIFERGHPEENHQNRRRWYLLCILAGLSHDIGKPYTDMVITTTAGEEWPKDNLPLLDWLQSVNASSYSVRYRKNREHNDHLEEAVAHMSMLIPEETFAFLSAAGQMQKMRAEFIRGILRGAKGGIVGRIIAHADGRSRKRDVLAQRDIQARYKEVENPQGSNILKAIQALINEKRWCANESAKSPIFVRKDDCFVVWSDDNAREIWGEAKVLGFESIPKEPAAMAEVLVESGAAYPNESEDGQRFSPLWNVTPILIEKGYVTCVRFRSPRYLFKDVAPEAIECVVEEIDIDDTTKAAWRKRWNRDPERLLNPEKEAERERLNYLDDDYVQTETTLIRNKEEEANEIALMESELADIEPSGEKIGVSVPHAENTPDEQIMGMLDGGDVSPAEVDAFSDLLPPSMESNKGESTEFAPTSIPILVKGKKKKAVETGEDLSIPEDQRIGVEIPHRKTAEEFAQERAKKEEELREANTYDRETKSFADNFKSIVANGQQKPRQKQAKNERFPEKQNMTRKRMSDENIMDLMPAKNVDTEQARNQLPHSDLLDAPTATVGLLLNQQIRSMSTQERAFGQSLNESNCVGDGGLEFAITRNDTFIEDSQQPLSESVTGDSKALNALDNLMQMPEISNVQATTGEADSLASSILVKGKNEANTSEEQGDMTFEKFVPEQTFSSDKKLLKTAPSIPSTSASTSVNVASVRTPDASSCSHESKQDNPDVVAEPKKRRRAKSLSAKIRLATSLENTLYAQLKTGHGEYLPEGIKVDPTTKCICADASALLTFLDREGVDAKFVADSFAARRPTQRLKLDFDSCVIFLVND